MSTKQFPSRQTIQVSSSLKSMEITMSSNFQDRGHRDDEPSRLTIAPLGQFRSGKSWYVAVAFQDAEGVDRVCAIPRRDCIRPFALRAFLADAGAPLGEDMNALRDVSREVGAGTLPTVEPAATSGWHQGGAFLFGDQFIGQPEGRIVVLAGEPAVLPLEVAVDGSSKHWREALEDLPLNSYALTLGLCVAFASAMAGPLGIDPRIIHFYGTSTGGKTLLLALARSVWGNPTRDRLPTWNTTAAGFEELAAQVRDHLLVIDEVTFKVNGPDDERILRQIHYSFSTNQPKRRSRQYEPTSKPIGRGSSKLGLSTGELSYAEVARRVGTGRFRGAVVRAIDIAADLEYGMGVFGQLPSDLEDLDDGARTYAQRIEAAALANYGRVGRYFVKHLVSNNGRWQDDARRRMQDFITGLGVGSDGYSIRFAEIFALAYAAGREAAEAGLLSWSKNDVRYAIERMYQVARENAPSPAEACERAISRLRVELECEALRLDPREDVDDQTFERYNAILRDVPHVGLAYCVKPSFMKSLCGIELSARDVALALDKLGVLSRDPKTPALPTRQVMIGAHRPKMRYYCILASFIRDQD